MSHRVERFSDFSWSLLKGSRGYGDLNNTDAVRKSREGYIVEAHGYSRAICTKRCEFSTDCMRMVMGFEYSTNFVVGHAERRSSPGTLKRSYRLG